MPPPTSRGAYTDYYRMWDLALADPTGVRFRIESFDGAVFHRTRLHMARKIDKDESCALYADDDPRHGVSAYDRYMVTIRKAADNDNFWLIISPRTVGVLAVESLAGTEYDTSWSSELEHEPPPRLSSPTGIARLEKNSDSTSDVPSDESSLTPSTQPEPEPPIPALRRS